MISLEDGKIQKIYNLEEEEVVASKCLKRTWIYFSLCGRSHASRLPKTAGQNYVFLARGFETQQG